MATASSSRLPTNRTLLAEAISLNTNVGSFTPLWRIRIKGNATAPASGTCTFADGSSLAYANTTTPTAAQFGVVYDASAGKFSIYDGTADEELGLGNTSGLRVVFNSNTNQGLIPCVASVSDTRASITLCTGAAGATATDPTGTAWTLDVEAFDSI